MSSCQEEEETLIRAEVRTREKMTLHRKNSVHMNTLAVEHTSTGLCSGCARHHFCVF